MRIGPFIGIGTALILTAPGAGADSRVVYETSFDASENYVEDELSGQNGWTHFGSGGNGIVVDFFENMGQQAYVGFSAPNEGDDFLSVLQPIQLDPVDEGRPLVKFSTQMEIVDSTNERYDDFRWSVYNSDEVRLFSLDFDNDTFAISYLLDGDDTFKGTGFSFESGGIYELEIWMDFAENQWSAALNGTYVVPAQRLGLPDTRKDLADIDAVWVMHDAADPGDNYLLFDNYRIEAHSEWTYPVTLRMTRDSSREPTLIVTGVPGQSYRVEASTDLIHWDKVQDITLPSPDGEIAVADPDAGEASRRFYRALPVDESLAAAESSPI